VVLVAVVVVLLHQLAELLEVVALLLPAALVDTGLRVRAMREVVPPDLLALRVHLLVALSVTAAVVPEVHSQVRQHPLVVILEAQAAEELPQSLSRLLHTD
jgi:hypothetical protein